MGNKHRSQASGEDGVRGGAGSIDKYGEVSEHRAGDHPFPAALRVVLIMLVVAHHSVERSPSFVGFGRRRAAT